MNGANHHNIPATLTAEFETFYRGIGFHPDNADNVIRLPRTEGEQRLMRDFCNETCPLHTGLHTNSYNETIAAAIRNIAN
jgi:hypothetical protein